MHEAKISALQLVFAGSLAQNKARSVLSVLAIALGVALGYAVQLITGAAVNELALGVQFLSGDADLQVRGPRSWFRRSGHPELARLREVAAASPVVRTRRGSPIAAIALKIIGIDVFPCRRREPGLVADSADRLIITVALRYAFLVRRGTLACSKSAAA
jgi:putative ABC transport system permease protein